MMRVVEIVLAAFAAVAAGWTSWQWWGYLNSSAYAPTLAGPSLWPLPAGYLLEIVALGLCGLISVSANRGPASQLWGNATWTTAGAFLTLVVLGAWSIGLFVAPTLFALVAAGALAGFRRRRRLWPQMGWFVVGLVAQALLMLWTILLR